MSKPVAAPRSAYDRAKEALDCRARIVSEASPRRYVERGLVSDNGERGSAQRCNVDALFGWDDLSALVLDYESLWAELKVRPTKDGFVALSNAFWKQQDRAIKAEGEAAILRQELATGGSGYLDDLSAKLGNAEAEVAALKAELHRWRQHSCVEPEYSATGEHASDYITNLKADRDRLRGLVNRYLADHCQPMPDGGPCDCSMCRDARKALEARHG